MLCVVTDMIEQMMAWESGQLSEDETVELFQELVDSGMAWKLQGTYGRTAAALIDQGLVTQPDPEPDSYFGYAGDGVIADTD